jgi:Tfp pilus assembly protein PilX
MSNRTQRGATLVIALIMLVLLTLFAISALNTSTTNLKVVGNMQARTEAYNAAQQGIDTVLSRTLFVDTPADAVVNPCGAANQLCIDKDGKPTAILANSYYTTKISGAPFDLVKPTCITARPIQNSELLPFSIPEDSDCAVGYKQGGWAMGTPPGDSLCANAVYQITAETTAVSGAKATVTQGIGIRVSTVKMEEQCVSP